MKAFDIESLYLVGGLRRRATTAPVTGVSLSHSVVALSGMVSFNFVMLCQGI